jgi:branched-subunit amino acid transport protein AzlD
MHLGTNNFPVNIYSHVIGCLIFLSLPYLIFTTGIPPRLHVATTADIVVCSIYLVGVAVCFAFSTMQVNPFVRPESEPASDISLAFTPSCISATNLTL